MRQTGWAGTYAALSVWRAVFSILESVAFDTGYAGSNGLEPQSWVNGNGTSYIYFGSGEFDGQGSGHDFYGTDWSHNNRYPSPAHHQGHDHAV